MSIKDYGQVGVLMFNVWVLGDSGAFVRKQGVGEKGPIAEVYVILGGTKEIGRFSDGFRRIFD